MVSSPGESQEIELITTIIKLNQTGNSRRFWWSIAELDIFKPLNPTSE
jgi:hypothetical protein